MQFQTRKENKNELPKRYSFDNERVSYDSVNVVDQSIPFVEIIKFCIFCVTGCFYISYEKQVSVYQFLRICIHATDFRKRALP